MTKYKAKASTPRNLRENISIALDEMFKALEESFGNLTDDQFWQWAVPGRHNIVTLIMHVQENIDRHACYLQMGEWALEHDLKFAIYGQPISDFEGLTDFPSVEEVQQRHLLLRDKVFSGLEEVTDRELFSPRCGEQDFWWQQHRRISIDAYNRVVWHANAHIRQIWLLRGALGAFGPEAFPQQFWH